MSNDEKPKTPKRVSEVQRLQPARDPSAAPPPLEPGEHEWRFPVEGEAKEAGGFCWNCGRPASQASIPCAPPQRRARPRLAG